MRAGGHAAGQVGEATGLDGVTEGAGHPNRLTSVGDRRVDEDGGAAELEGDRGMGRRPDTGVHEDGDAAAVHDLGDVVEVLDPESRADRGPERHDGGRSRLLGPPGDEGIVGHLRELYGTLPDAALDAPVRAPAPLGPGGPPVPLRELFERVLAGDDGEAGDVC